MLHFDRQLARYLHTKEQAMNDTAQQPAAESNPALFDVDRYAPDSFDRSQSALRTILGSHFHSNRKAWNIVTLLRQRVAISQYDSAVCDVCVLHAEAPVERVVRVPPLICIDIVTEESLAAVQRRVDSYASTGVKHVWLLDAAYRCAWRATSSGLFQVRDDQMMIAGTSIGFRLTAVFEELDELMQPGKRLSVSAAIERARGK